MKKKKAPTKAYDGFLNLFVFRVEKKKELCFY